MVDDRDRHLLGDEFFFLDKYYLFSCKVQADSCVEKLRRDKQYFKYLKEAVSLLYLNELAGGKDAREIQRLWKVLGERKEDDFKQPPKKYYTENPFYDHGYFLYYLKSRREGITLTESAALLNVPLGKEHEEKLKKREENANEEDGKSVEDSSYDYSYYGDISLAEEYRTAEGDEAEGDEAEGDTDMSGFIGMNPREYTWTKSKLKKVKEVNRLVNRRVKELFDKIEEAKKLKADKLEEAKKLEEAEIMNEKLGETKNTEEVKATTSSPTFSGSGVTPPIATSTPTSSPSAIAHIDTLPFPSLSIDDASLHQRNKN